MVVIVALAVVCCKQSSTKTATTAFEEIKRNLADEQFDDPAEMLASIKKGCSEMEAFLLLCDSSVTSSDELTKSAAVLCCEAIGHGSVWKSFSEVSNACPRMRP